MDPGMRKRASWAAAASVASFGALMLFATPARAIDNDGYFQIEGDVCGGGSRTAGATNCVDNGGPPPTVIQPGGQDDWDTIFTCSGSLGNCSVNPGGPPPNMSEAPAFIFETANNVFTGGGSKDQLDIPKWKYATGKTAPDKDTIVEAFAAVYKPTAGYRANHKLIYFGANRFAVDGDAQIGFWFFQDTVGQDGSGGFTGKHKAGDVLILSNFVKGGGQSNIQVFVVQSVDSKGNVTFGTPLGANNTSGNKVCLGAPNPNTTPPNLPDTACAATNGAVSTALDPNFAGKGFSAGLYDVVGFFEGGIDLTEFGNFIGQPGLGSECFGSFMVETRSSQSITAVLKDFALGPFEGCSAKATTQIHLGTDHATDVQGTTVPEQSKIHDKVILTSGPGNPAVGGTVTFNFYSTADCTGTAVPAGSPSLVAANPPTTPATSTAESSEQGPLAAGSYSFQAEYNGDDPNYPNKIKSVCETITVSSPNVAVTKSCLASYSGTTVTINFSGTVTNTGSEDLHGVVITDNPTTNNITQPTNGLLAKGATFNYSGSFTTSWPGGTTNDFPDTVTVDAYGVNNGHVSAQASKDCSITINPAISIDKTCSTVLVSDSGKLVVKVNFSGTVKNTGDTPLSLTATSLSDSPAATITGQCTTTSTLNAGDSCTYSGSYFPTSLTTTGGTANDTMTVNASVVLSGAPISKSAPQSCNLCPLPGNVP